MHLDFCTYIFFAGFLVSDTDSMVAWFAPCPFAETWSCSFLCLPIISITYFPSIVATSTVAAAAFQTHTYKHPRQPGLPDFSLFNIPKRGELYHFIMPLYYQMGIKYNKWPYFIVNGHGLYQLFSFQGPPKFAQIWIFGLKTYHLATRTPTHTRTCVEK
jgi:hypothetical protein